jgi:hypothetical protein
MQNEKQHENILNIPPAYQYPPWAHQQDDEIDLKATFHILLKNRVIILGVALSFFLVGLVYSVFNPKSFTYSASLQIGSFYENGRFQPIDEPKNIESKIKNVFIPLEIDNYYRTSSAPVRGIAINVKLPPDSKVILLESTAKEKDAEVYNALINKVVSRFLKNQDAQISNIKNSINQQIQAAKKELSFVFEQQKLISSRLEEFEKILKTTTKDAGGMTALAISELYTQQQAINSRKFSIQNLVDNKLSDLNRIEETKFLSPVTKSFNYVGLGNLAITLLWTLSGLVAGILIALLLNMLKDGESN